MEHSKENNTEKTVFNLASVIPLVNSTLARFLKKNKINKMKKSLLLIVFTILFASLQAQLEEQQEYTGFLEQALEALNNKDQHEFTTNMKYFSTAIERDKITPEILTKKNLELYSKCISIAVDKKAILNFGPADIAFLEYGADRFPENIRILAHGYNGVWGFPKDYEKVYYWLDKALEKEAMPAEEVMPRLPDCENPDCEAAMIDFLEKWAGKGMAVAMNKLAEFYTDKIDRLPGNENEKKSEWLDKARTWYEKAFEAGGFYQKAKAAKGLSLVYGRKGSSKKEKQWKKEYLHWLEICFEDLEKNNTKEGGSWSKYMDILNDLAFGYEYEIKDKKKATFYKEKACQYGLTTYCGK